MMMMTIVIIQLSAMPAWLSPAAQHSGGPSSCFYHYRPHHDHPHDSHQRCHDSSARARTAPQRRQTQIAPAVFPTRAKLTIR